MLCETDTHSAQYWMGKGSKFNLYAFNVSSMCWATNIETIFYTRITWYVDIDFKASKIQYLKPSRVAGRGGTNTVSFIYPDRQKSHGVRSGKPQAMNKILFPTNCNNLKLYKIWRKKQHTTERSLQTKCSFILLTWTFSSLIMSFCLGVFVFIKFSKTVFSCI